MPKPKPSPDTRLSWRDPQMPVWRNYLMPDGTRREWVDPTYGQAYRAWRMQSQDQTNEH